jgi:hypothetical protein
MGQTSEAYAVVSVWKTPHGIPQKTSPMTSMVSDSAKTMMKMKAVRQIIEICMTILGPKRSAAQPLILKNMDVRLVVTSGERGNWAYEETDDTSSGGTVTEGRLPLGGNDITDFSSVCRDTEALEEVGYWLVSGVHFRSGDRITHVDRRMNQSKAVVSKEHWLSIVIDLQRRHRSPP